MINRLTINLYRSFLGPFVLTFFLVIVIFIMQFVWKYVDDIMGKGIEWYYIAELIILKSANLVSLALPLAILLSSTMTMGTLAEHYELATLKSAGLSLFRIIRPLITFVLLAAVFSLLFNNYVTPTAEIKFKQILWDIVQKKPMMELKDGVFYNDLTGYSIRVKQKNEETGELFDVLIYDHRVKAKGNRTVIRAERGRTLKSPSGKYMFLELYNGVSYDEQDENRKKDRNHPLVKSRFEKSVITLDLSDFMFEETDEERFNNMMSRLNMKQLEEVQDSLTQIIETKTRRIEEITHKAIFLHEDIPKKDSLQQLAAPLPYFDDLDLSTKSRTVALARSSLENLKTSLRKERGDMGYYVLNRINAKIVWHDKLALAFACIIFFFIGAPLGAIIKKGGLGLPVLTSIILFLIFHITSISGRKMAKSGILEPWQGIWLAAMVLLPIGVFLTYKAATDSVIFDRESYIKFFKRIFKRKKRYEDSPAMQ